MNRLSIADLKAQKGNVVANLEAIKGGADNVRPSNQTPSNPSGNDCTHNPNPKGSV
jgi:hypothetical protein